MLDTTLPDLSRILTIEKGNESLSSKRPTLNFPSLILIPKTKTYIYIYMYYKYYILYIILYIIFFYKYIYIYIYIYNFGKKTLRTDSKE